MDSSRSGAPVGTQGLTPVGSPNRVPRRAAPSHGSPRFTTPQFPRTESRAPEEGTANARSTFSERIYQSTGRLRSRIGADSRFGMSEALATPTAQRGEGMGGRIPQTVGPDRLYREAGLTSSESLDAPKRALAPPPPQLARPVAASRQAKRKTPISAIPASVVDLPSQRIYALAVLGLLSAWKLYDALGLAMDSDETSVYLFLKWCVLDVALWYAAWRLHIPRLLVSTNTMYLLVAASLFINLNLFFLSSSILVMAIRPAAVSIASSCLRSVKSVPWIGPRLVGDSDLLIDSFELDDRHILGRHTIHILPHSLAHMNPESKSFCIDQAAARADPWYWRYTVNMVTGSHTPRASIPILVNGTRPASITYAYTSFETGQRQLRTVRNVGSLQMEANAVYPTLGSWVLATYHLPVTEVGAYEIHSVKDRQGLEFRTATQAPPAIVVSCPHARLQWRDDADAIDSFSVGGSGHASICQRAGQTPASSTSSDGGLIQVVAEGYEPMEMTIVRLVNGHREVISLDGIQPQPVDDSAVPGSNEALTLSQLSAIEKWSRYRARKSAYTLSDTFLRPGEYVYKLESIRDAANHSVALSDLSTKGIFDTDKANEGKATPYMARIQVHQRPGVGWADAVLNVEQPLRLSSDEMRKSQYDLPLRLSGNGPWTVDYIIVEGDNVSQESATFADAMRPTIDASKPGIYHLLGVSDKHCAGQAEKTNVTLAYAPVPTANVSSTAITAHECGGEIGALIDLELTGRPPFAVHYRERNLRFPHSKPVTKVVRSQQRRHTFKVMPELAGTYELEFFLVEDDNYPSGQPMAATIQQAIHAQPSAKLDTINGRIPTRACRGEELEIPVRLKGQGPWELTYNVVYENRRTTKTVADITEESYTIDVGSFDQPGDYIVEVVQVKDGNKCARDLLDVTATINVREGGPRVGFQCPEGGVRVLDGEQAQIPLHVVGEFPVEVRYQKVGDAPEHTYKATITRKSHNPSQSDSVLAYGPGVYELVSASDICAGTIDPSGARCAVHVEPKPSAWFVTDSLQRSTARADNTGVWRLHEACEGVPLPGTFELGLSGSGPWKIAYRVDFWAASNPQSGVPSFVDRTSVHSLVALPASALKAEGGAPGLYRYTLTSVSDERYQKPQNLLAAYEAMAPGAGVTVVEHVVAPSPLAALRAYSPDGTPLDMSSSRSGFRRKPPSIKHCLAPGQSTSDGDAQTWAKLHEHLPEFRIEFAQGGLSPFEAWIEVFPASGPSEVVHISDIDGTSQPIMLPDNVASQIGRYHMRLVRTRDARGCEHQFVDPNQVGLGRPDHDAKAIAGGIEIEYIEAPNAKPSSSSPAANPSRDVCVGDVLAFDLRGLNSWNIEYIYNDVGHTTSVSKRLFRRIADTPGNFTLSRVCHRSANDCCSEFNDLAYAVHNIPRVRVSGGKDVYQDILEGDKVDISMELTGTPPFTFTWQRRSLGAGQAGKILESHTVKDLDHHTYTISASSEDTFEVTFVQDRYCQYPKA
ncbi:hypothetical protein GGF46_001877 [Coemansia sp. RSA 552]|nr:hypothetical protein GGF46_001877 [Coemansia sp. RSA 552]